MDRCRNGSFSVIKKDDGNVGRGTQQQYSDEASMHCAKKVDNNTANNMTAARRMMPCAHRRTRLQEACIVGLQRQTRALLAGCCAEVKKQHDLAERRYGIILVARARGAEDDACCLNDDTIA